MIKRGTNDSAEVKAIQEILRADPRYKNLVGAADGDFGGKTEKAIIQFQKDNGIDPANGVVDENTLKEILISANKAVDAGKNSLLDEVKLLTKYSEKEYPEQAPAQPEPSREEIRENRSVILDAATDAIRDKTYQNGMPRLGEWLGGRSAIPDRFAFDFMETGKVTFEKDGKTITIDESDPKAAEKIAQYTTSGDLARADKQIEEGHDTQNRLTKAIIAQNEAKEAAAAKAVADAEREKVEKIAREVEARAVAERQAEEAKAKAAQEATEKAQAQAKQESKRLKGILGEVDDLLERDHGGELKKRDGKFDGRDLLHNLRVATGFAAPDVPDEVADALLKNGGKIDLIDKQGNRTTIDLSKENAQNKDAEMKELSDAIAASLGDLQVTSAGGPRPMGTAKARS